MFMLFMLPVIFILMYEPLFLEGLLYISSLCVFIFLFALLNNWFHIIMILMFLEMMMLQIFLIVMTLCLNLFSLSFLFLFSTFMVIEASLGVSILTLITRSHGNDFLLIF
uniref:NADH dehydrogenase subunit 4L n=1 Tax=Phyllodiaptomus tunguidus TaxID=2690417 RepID=A0A8K1KWZ4_9MAXI|nr:NADH dehydrogenase subunit 4L [Phyllodiaptomus tunguidus]UDF84448.1 NADH dehydrogenase subunit 4L [Phyllodiaptomus tunguidus]